MCDGREEGHEIQGMGREKLSKQIPFISPLPGTPTSDRTLGPTTPTPNFFSLGLLSQRGPSAWIFDCGATDTMTFDPKDLTSCIPTPHTHIQTANGEYVSVDTAGSVAISDTLHSSHCLLIPSLSHKLLSVSQLTKELDCTVLLTSNECIVQDVRIGKILGHGTKRDGLYYVAEAPSQGHAILAHGSPEHQLQMWH